jgi:hypothetical protein
MRTHKDKLHALLHYLELNIEIATHRLRAESFYDIEDETTSWEYLFRWVKAKDRRAKMWEWFQDEYPDAIMLKEGYYE